MTPSPRFARLSVSVPALAFVAIGLTACTDDSVIDHKDLLERYPDGSMVGMGGTDGHPFLDGQNINIIRFGVSVPIEDGSGAANEQGPWMSYYRDGDDPIHWSEDQSRVPSAWVKESAGEYKDGKRDGEWTFWHRNGQMRAKGSLTDGGMTGVWRVFKDDGTIDAELSGSYDANGKRVGGVPAR